MPERVHYRSIGSSMRGTEMKIINDIEHRHPYCTELSFYPLITKALSQRKTKLYGRETIKKCQH